MFVYMRWASYMKLFVQATLMGASVVRSSWYALDRIFSFIVINYALDLFVIVLRISIYAWFNIKTTLLY